jgi:2-polyprenyl-3-methyl-5-hydroxy-6-metoxy-1,4-benzoquinol methylase
MPTNREVFDEIAKSWYGYRHWSRFSHDLEQLAARWRKGRLINIGCAHGPDFQPFKSGFDLYGMDFSSEMVKLAVKYAAKFDFRVELATVCSIMQLPLHPITISKEKNTGCRHSENYIEY